jgi:hypothetical protein
MLFGAGADGGRTAGPQKLWVDAVRGKDLRAEDED